MSTDDRTLIRWGRLLSGTSVVVAIISMGVLVVLGQRELFIEVFIVHNGLLAIGLGSLTWVTIRTQARNGAVWALAWAAFFGALFTASFAAFALLIPSEILELSVEEISALSPSDLPVAAALALQPGAWAWVPAFILVVTLGLLLFPDGRPPSPRWRWVGWYSVAMIVVAVVSLAWLARPSSTLPIDIPLESSGTVGLIAGAAIFLTMVGVVLSVAALIVRYRGSSGVTRRQIRWIAWGGTFFAAILVLTQLVEGPTGSGASLPSYLGLVGEALLILSFAVAITRYRLYDIDVVISKTVTYVALSIFITAVYVGIVVGIGTLAGAGGEPNLALAIGATALVALLFEPIRSRVQHWANRLVYGERATPYAVLSELTARFSEADSNEEAMERLAELLVSGAGAEEAVVWLRVGDQLRPEAATSSVAPEPVPIDNRTLPELPGEAAEPILHAGELLGALSISKSKADPVTPSDQRLLEDVAAGAGLLLRNIQLNAELADRAEELRFSRRRLVAAQDLERRRLERNLHDGAQQQVVAIKVKLGLARTLAQREEVGEVADAVGELSADTQRAVDGMRAAARGIYPPLLEAEGVRAALVAAGRESAVPIDIESDGFGRYPPEIEATIYFCVLEALGSMGGPETTRVSLGDNGEMVTFSVQNASAGSSSGHGLTAVADRVEALGGTLEVEPVPGGGTVVTGRLPATALERL